MDTKKEIIETLQSYTDSIATYLSNDNKFVERFSDAFEFSDGSQRYVGHVQITLSFQGTSLKECKLALSKVSVTGDNDRIKFYRGITATGWKEDI